MSNYERLWGLWRKALLTQLHLWHSCQFLWLEKGSTSSNFVRASHLLQHVAADIPLDQDGKDEPKNSFLAGFASIWDHCAGKSLNLRGWGISFLHAKGWIVRFRGEPHTTVTLLLIWQSWQTPAGGELFFLGGNFTPHCVPWIVGRMVGMKEEMRRKEEIQPFGWKPREGGLFHYSHAC